MSVFTKTVAALSSGLAMMALALAPTQARAMVVTPKDAAFLAMFAHPPAAMAFAHLMEGKRFADDDCHGHGRSSPHAVVCAAPGALSPDLYGSIYLELLDTLGPVALGSGSHFKDPLPEIEPEGFYLLSQADGVSSAQQAAAAEALAPSSIPEPATFALLLAALAASLISVRRNGHAAAARLAAAASHHA